MGKKLIYFVRHGETKYNSLGIRQGEEGGLTEKGKEQALATAKKFPTEKGKPEVIISSPWQRTDETAHIIAKELNMKIEYSPLLIERRNPSEVIGRTGKDNEVRHIIDTIDKSFHQDELRYSDEENFVDLKNRAKDLLKFISKRKESRIIMVTHGIFLKMLASYIKEGENLTAPDYVKLSFFNDLNNAAITVVQYIPHWFQKDEWKILVWNGEMEDKKIIF